jgi:hypothetical protein
VVSQGAEALHTVIGIEIAGTCLKVISPVAFLAAKHGAYVDRGDSNCCAGGDLGDPGRCPLNAVEGLFRAPDFGEPLP